MLFITYENKIICQRQNVSICIDYSGVGETQAEAIIKLIEKEGHFENIEITKDLQKIDRIVSAR